MDSGSAGAPVDDRSADTPTHPTDEGAGRGPFRPVGQGVRPVGQGVHDCCETVQVQGLPEQVEHCRRLLEDAAAAAPETEADEGGLPPFPYSRTLDKRSENLGFFQPRLFEVDRGSLKYFKEGCHNPRGAFGPGDVQGVAEQLPSTVLVRARLAGGEERIYELRAADEMEMHIWVELILRAFDLDPENARSQVFHAPEEPPPPPVPNGASTSSLARSSITGMVGHATGFALGAAHKALVATGRVVDRAERAAGIDGWIEDRWAHATRLGSGYREQLEMQMESAVSSADEGRVQQLLDGALGTGILLARPSGFLQKAARRTAGRTLKDAMASRDAKMLKGALVAARRLQAVDVPEFEPAARMYKDIRKLPADWSVEKMVEDHKAGDRKLYTRKDVSDDYALRALVQLMFDRTFRAVLTRDRLDKRLPEQLQVVSVTQVENESQWVDYMARRAEIIEDVRGQPTVEHPTADSPPTTAESTHPFWLADVETEKAVAEAAAIVALGDSSSDDPLAFKVTIPEGKNPGDVMEMPSPVVSGQMLRIVVPKGTGPAREILVRAPLAAQLPGPATETVANEVWLFHGTRSIAAEKITAEDFRIDLAGTSAGSLYGRGVYLAENCSKADEYSQPDAKGNFTMLLCRVTLGKMMYSAEVRPDPRACEDVCMKGDCHSVLGDRKACRGTFREFIVFDEDQVYPSFVVNYRRL